MITIQQSPHPVSPAYNPLIWVVTTDNSSEDNFRVIADIYINGTLEVSWRLPLVPGTATCVVDARRVVEQYVTSNFTPSADKMVTCPESIKIMEVHFGEAYGDPVVDHPDLVTSDEVVVWNAAVKTIDWPLFDPDAFRLGLGGLDGIGVRALTDNAGLIFNTQKISLTQSAWLYFLQWADVNNRVHHAQIIAYNAAGAAIATTVVRNTRNNAASSGIVADQMLIMPSGPYNLNLIDSAEITTGAQPIIPATTAYYEIRFFKTAGGTGQTGIYYRYDITSYCNEVFRLHWLNSLGGFDSFNFSKLFRKPIDIKRETYVKSPGALSDDGNSFGYTKASRGKVAYSTRTDPRLIITTDWLSQNESQWLESLVTSGEVYLEESDHSFTAMTVETSSYETKYKRFEPLFQLQLELSYSFTNKRQGA